MFSKLNISFDVTLCLLLDYMTFYHFVFVLRFPDRPLGSVLSQHRMPRPIDIRGLHSLFRYLKIRHQKLFCPIVSDYVQFVNSFLETSTPWDTHVLLKNLVAFYLLQVQIHTFYPFLFVTAVTRRLTRERFNVTVCLLWLDYTVLTTLWTRQLHICYQNSIVFLI